MGGGCGAPTSARPWRSRSRLGHALSAAKRRKHQVAVFYLDLDDFKQINDGLGHEAGDQLLIRVAERLRATVRLEDTPARLGGDEFAVLAEGLSRKAADDLARRLLGSLQQPFQLAGQQVTVGGSVGVAFAAPGETSPEDVLRNADVAMYVAKNSGKGRFSVFESGMYQQVKEELELELDLRYALEHEEFELHYQPILSLEAGDLVGVEALVRWRDDVRHQLRMPGEFLPLAERTGLILPLGQWILEHACRQAHEWHALFPEAAPMLLSVNLSERQFLDPGLVETVEHALASSGLSGDQLISPPPPAFSNFPKRRELAHEESPSDGSLPAVGGVRGGVGGNAGPVRGHRQRGEPCRISQPVDDRGAVSQTRREVAERPQVASGGSGREPPGPGRSSRSGSSAGISRKSRSFWQSAIFSGRDIPPPKKATDAEVVAFVARYPGAIGYVSRTTPLVAGVKVLQIHEQ